jgi:hypothetical protein
MTAAERQRRRRARLAKERKAADLEATRAKNRAKYAASLPARMAELEEWKRNQPPPEAPLVNLADELAAQIADACRSEGIPIEEVRDALDRLIGDD